MKTIDKTLIWILCIVLISSFAAAYSLEEEEKEDTLLINKHLDTVDSLKTTDTKQAKKRLTSVADYVDLMGYEEKFGARIDTLKKELGYTWRDGISPTDISPVEHPFYWLGFLVIAVGVFFLMRRKKKKKVLGSLEEIKKVYSELKNVKKLFGEIYNCIIDKGGYIKKNQEYLEKLRAVVKSGNYAALYTAGLKELTTNWAKDIKDNIIKKNKKIIENIKRIQQFTEKELPSEQQNLLKNLEEDANKIKSIQHKYEVVGEGIVGPGGSTVAAHHQRFVNSLREIYKKNMEIGKILNQKILPYQIYIYNYIKIIHFSVINEEKCVEGEDSVLEALSTKKIKGRELPEAVKTLILYNRRKVGYYKGQLKNHEKFNELLKKDKQMLKWMRSMELNQESKLKLTLRDADMVIRKEFKTGGLTKKREGKPLELIKTKEWRHGSEVPKEIWKITELYDVVGPHYIGNESFQPLLYRKEDEENIKKELDKIDEDKKKINGSINKLTRELRASGGTTEKGKIIIPEGVDKRELEDIEHEIKLKEAELKKKDEDYEKAETKIKDLKKRNYPKSELNDVGTWLIKEYDHLGEEHTNVIKPLGKAIGVLGPDDVNKNRAKIKDYLEKYFPHVKQ